MKTKTSDPTIDRIREVRSKISAEFGHDPKRLLEHYAELEKDSPGRFLGDEAREIVARKNS